MDFYDSLTILTCVTSTVTMILVAVAVTPHIKHGLLVIRDAILWVTFVLVVALGIWLGWQRLSSRLSGGTVDGRGGVLPTETRATSATRTGLPWRGDPYYRGSIEDPP